MSANSHGSYRTTKEAMMKAFDKLPKSIRVALAESDENWVPQPLRTAFERGNATATELAFRVARWDAERRSSKSMARVWGPGHPQAMKATKDQIRKGKRK